VITQRLIIDGGTPTCIGCHSPLTEGLIQHPDDCEELRRGNVSGPLPSPAQVYAWLGAHGWAMVGTGEGGSAWTPPGHGRDSWVGIPDDAGDVHPLAGALERIASRSGLPFGEVLAGMRATEVGEESDG
jgi:hypothetical protein